jgi:hypothetical protein
MCGFGVASRVVAKELDRGELASSLLATFGVIGAGAALRADFARPAPQVR